MLAAISPMIVWAVYFVTAYSVQGLGCARGWSDGTTTGALLALSVVALAVVAGQGVRAWSKRAEFDGRVGFVLAVLAGIAIVLNALPIVMLEPCAP